MKQIELVQDKGYGKFEYDILTVDGYVGLIQGTETRNGIIWEITAYDKGQVTGVLRLPVMNLLEATKMARILCVKE